jgi:hypothetical protein
MPASAAAKEKYVIPVPAISRRTFVAGGTAVGASLLLSQMARPESLAGVDAPPLKECDIATNDISLHVTEQGEGPARARSKLRLFWVRSNQRAFCR